MTAKQQSSLQTEMEIVKSLMKLTPEERQKEVRRYAYIELRAAEMRRRERVALEIAERCKREKEREKATESQRRQKEKHERMRQEQDQLKKEGPQWKKGMLVEEELGTRPWFILPALKKQPRVEDKAGPNHLTSDLKAKEQRKMKILSNNWVGKPVKEKPHPHNSLFTAKLAPKPEEKQTTPKSGRSVQERLTPEYWVRMYQAYTKRKELLKSGEQNVGANCPSRNILNSVF